MLLSATLNVDSGAAAKLHFDPVAELFPRSATSFDCTKAVHYAEILICHDEELASSDKWMDGRYWRLKLYLDKPSRVQVRAEQRRWLATRNACTDRVCVMAAYSQRQGQLEDRRRIEETRIRTTYARVGLCGTARIALIGPRIEQEAHLTPNGTTVVLDNGLGLASYEHKAKAWASRLRDRVRFCLTSIPRHRPSNDYCGRVYEVANLRTSDRWSIPDSHHGCGGA